MFQRFTEWLRKPGRSRKATLGIWLGLFVVGCCVLSTIIGAIQGTGRAVGILPTLTPTPLPTATAVPTEVPTPKPTSTPAPTKTPAPPTATPEPTAVPTATPPPEPIVISGSGQTVTDAITPFPGVNKVTLEHNGRRNFIVKLYDAAGNDDLMVNTIGSYAGVRPMTDGAGKYFEVDADGAWKITIEPIAEQPDATALSGQGDNISGFFMPTKTGPVPYNFTHNGERNFIVHLYCAGGDDGVQNEIGPVDGSSVVRFSKGPCFWDVRADGAWSINPK